MKAPFKLPRFTSHWSGILLATIFALLFSAVGNIEYLLPVFRVELNHPSPITIRLPSSIYLRANVVRNQYAQKWHPIRIGETISNQERFNFVDRYIQAKKKGIVFRLIGFFVAALVLALFVSQSIRLSWPGRRRYLRSEIACYLLLILSQVGVKAFLLFTFVPFTLMPLASIPAITTFFLGKRIGTMTGIVTAFTAGMFLDLDLIAFIYFLFQSLSVLPILKYYRTKKRFLAASAAMTLVGAVMIPAMTILLVGAPETEAIRSWRNSHIIAALPGGLLSYPMFWALHSILRVLLGIVSAGKLNELQ